MAQVMAKHLQETPPFEELAGFQPAVVTLLAHMLEKDPLRRPATPAHLVAEIERCVAQVESGTRGSNKEQSLSAPVVFASQPIPVLPKVSATREPVTEPPRRQYVLEILIGTIIALVIYLILSQPIESTPTSPATAPTTSETNPK
jgi:hypothetical protein